MDQFGGTILVALAIIGGFFLCVWLARDAQRRGKSPVLVILLVLVLNVLGWGIGQNQSPADPGLLIIFNILGLILWLLFRPDNRA